MLHRSLSLLAAGLLLLASCTQPAIPDAPSGTAAPTSASPEAASVLALQQALTDLRASQAVVDAGGAVPMDASGQPVDLQALIRSYEADLAAATRAALLAPTLHPLDAYSQNYFVIVDDDNFRANHGNWVHYFPAYTWSTDGCSGPARYTGYNDNFYWPCVQHDFGYRNASFTGNHNDATRSHVDGAFQRHMNQLCSHYAILAKPGCYAASEAFYLAVRVGGGSSFH